MFGGLQNLVMFVITTGCFVIQAWALIDCLRRPERAFTSEGKKTKKFWSILLGAFALIGFTGLQPPLGVGMLGITTLFVTIPAFIYFADVKPAIAPYGFGGSGNNGNNRNSGGW